MMESLIIRIVNDAGGDPLVQWALFRGTDRILEAEQLLPVSSAFGELPASLGPDRRIIVLVPGTDVLLTTVAIPPAQRRHREQVLPFLIEDQLAEDISQLHLAASPAEDNQGRTPVAVVRKTLMTQWLEALRLAGIEPQMMLAEMMALPTPPENEWRLLYDGQTIWLRTARDNGSVIEASALPLVLQSLSPPARIECILAGDGVSPAILQSFTGTLILHNETWPASAFDYLARACLQNTAGETNVLNLLQGEFATLGLKTGQNKKDSKLARAAVFFFIAALVLQGGQGLYFLQQAKTKQAQILNLYSQAFPADTRIVNPIQQMKNHLQARQSPDGSGFLALLKKTAGRIGADYPLDLQSLNYSEESHKLTMDIAAQNLESLNGLAQRVDGEPLNARLLSVNKDKDKIQAQLSVEQK